MKTFTLSEANAALAELIPDLEKLQRHHHLLTSQREAAEAASAAAESGGGGMALGTEYVNALCELREITSALDERGIEIKDFARGLIDFPSLRNGRLIYFCWQLGEGSEIRFWHEQDGGFAGRKPL
ncbi:MAG: hypothetical protein UZ17_ACD001001541 [Acidobacteria bacterium OLB17]|nr:MAG: hypothetical protein UZ17_ACD001001541 [Acidobacteria bacterium OLB17]MCZ2391345.1 DUF2203 domain-containing protein [Acidobacteriota bacterium]